MSKNLDIKSLKTLPSLVLGYAKKLQPFSLIIFGVFVALLYGFVLFRSNSLNNQQPSDVAVSGQVQASKVLKVDNTVYNQLKTLRDNSVSVQTLFDQNRSNPFQ